MNDLVQEKTYDNGLTLFKYKRKVFYDNLWDDELVKYRGMVKDADDNIVAYPFDKVFNYSENNAGLSIPLNNYVLAVEKVNGFLAVASVYEGELLVSTTGTLDSDFAKLAKEVLVSHGLTAKKVSGYTMMFEVCHVSDPHIIEEEHGLYFIGARDMKTLEMVDSVELDRFELGIEMPTFRYVKLGELLAEAKTAQIEGWMIYEVRYDLKEPEVLKLKTKFYLITKFLARNKKYINAFWAKNTKPKVDEEYYPLLGYIKENYTKDYWLTLVEKAKVDIITQFLKV